MVRKTTNKLLPDGLVTEQQYEELVASAYFKQIETFSDNFISKAGPLIQRYNIRWVSDPLHQWSRQWEYPYIISQAQRIDKRATVVDLGVGMSFLPYYLKAKLGFGDVVGVDYDKMLSGLYKKVNAIMDEEVSFQYGDMRSLDALKSKSVDFVYSVSVLEHTDAYPVILKEIYRILKPGGKLSFTFDISLNGLDDIPLEKAHDLLVSLEDTFKVDTNIDLDSGVSQENLITSYGLAKRDKGLMPWKYPIVNVVKPLIKHRKPGSLYKQLTFCCVTATKGA